MAPHAKSALAAGARVDSRFLIESVAGAGGMAVVYRAHDERTMRPVAVKVLRGELLDGPAIGGVSPSPERRRFARESTLLAQLVHPQIARYVDQGSVEGSPYLVMEWIEGESLAERLRRGAMSVSELLAFGRSISGALVVVHELGIVHRDLKPTNIMLGDGRFDRPILLDFGISQLARASAGETTGAGTILGTAAYMSPEQARGVTRIDARADVFSLGCVFFRCLTGRSPFEAESYSASLAKVLFEEAPGLRQLVRGVPPELEALIARMLHKEVTERPLGGPAVLAALRSIESDPTAHRALQVDDERMSIEPALRALVTVIVIGRGSHREQTTVASSDQRDAERHPAGSVEDRLGRRAAVVGASVHPLPSGAFALTLSGYGNAVEQAVRGAECALAIRSDFPDAALSVATGCALVDGASPAGEVVDRAVAMVMQASIEASRRAADIAPVRLDAVTAGLIADRCNVEARGGVAELIGSRQEADFTGVTARTKLVGRRGELRRLRALYRACVDERAPRVTVVTGTAGMGKSRLVSELCRGLRRGARRPEVWSARADMPAAGSSLAILAQLVRSALDISEAAPLEAQREQLDARLGRRLAPELRAHVTEFVAEVLGAPVPGDLASPTLRAARQDQRLMGEHVLLALTAFLAEARDEPVVMVIDNAHWADAGSLHLLRAALRAAPRTPVLWVAMARPEIHARLPGFWDAAAAEEICLGPLSRATSAALVRTILERSAPTPPSVVDRVVARANGNPLYLEGLARAVLQRQDDTLPATLVAMAQARLDELEPDARRVLCAASVFGTVFWKEAVAPLLGPSLSTDTVRRHLRALEDAELVAARRATRFRGACELAFQSDLLREATYATLSAEDRRVAHRLAAEWLETMGERAPLVLANHLELAGELGRAVSFQADAAEHAFALNDAEACLACVRRGAGLGVAGEPLGRLLCCEGQVHAASGRHADAQKRAREALAVLGPGTDPWYVAATLLVNATASLGQREVGQDVARRIQEVVEASPPSLTGLKAAVAAAQQLILLGLPAEAGAAVQVAEVARGRLPEDPAADMLLCNLRGHQAVFVGDEGGRLTQFETALSLAERVGDLRAACIFAVNSGAARLELGDYPAAGAALDRALALATRLRFHRIGLVARENLAWLMALRGELGVARAASEELVEATAGTNPRVEGMARLGLATAHFLADDLAAAEAEARRAAAALEELLPLRPAALGLLARVLTAAGRHDEALIHAGAAMEAIEALGHVETGEAVVRLALAEALRACGRVDEARAVLEVARGRLSRRAATLPTDALRASYLGVVPENAATLRLAEELSGR